MGWPQLRDELHLLDGPSLRDGQPSWLIHDPVRHLFFRIDWMTFEILSRWWLGDREAIAQSVAEATTLQPEPADVQQVLGFLQQHQLTQIPPGQSAHTAAAQRRARANWLTWLLHHYLFFRVPLVRPDAWLARALPLARAVIGRPFAWATGAALVVGLVQLARQWDTFQSALLDTMSLDGLLAFGVALSLSKVLHELGHAMTAKHFGCRVPTMGVAFLVMWPVAYTDTNESWRLRNRWQRLQIASAGMAAELVLAAWATLLWALLPDGVLRSAALVLCTITWVTTLAINASPFMRFDGYFILSDALDFPNLHERSFALARWRLREWLFDLGDPPPEMLGARRQAALIAFAVATWLYRLVLFAGIALLVYHFFFKALGVFLFAVEVAWFILWPIGRELRVWRQRAGDIVQRRRWRWGALGWLLLLLVLLLPWPGRMQATGLLRPAQVLPLYTAAGAQLVELPAQDSAQLAPPQLLFRLSAPELLQREQTMAARRTQQAWLNQSAQFAPEMRAQMQAVQDQQATTDSAAASLDVERARLEPQAPFAGTFHSADPDLAPGQWVARRERLGQLVAAQGPWVVETWLDEASVRRLKRGDTAYFVLPGHPLHAVALRVQEIDRDASRTLPRGELASARGGHLSVRERQGVLVPEQAVYRVSLAPVDPVPPALQGHAWRGELTLHVAGQSPLGDLLRHMGAVLIREFGF